MLYTICIVFTTNNSHTIKKSGMHCGVYILPHLCDLQYGTFMLNDFCICLPTHYLFIYLFIHSLFTPYLGMLSTAQHLYSTEW
jgi:hypothetical protein